MVRIVCQAGGRIIDYAVKILEGFPWSERLIPHRFNANHWARRLLDICPKHNLSLFNCGSNAYSRKERILQAGTARSNATPVSLSSTTARLCAVSRKNN